MKHYVLVLGFDVLRFGVVRSELTSPNPLARTLLVLSVEPEWDADIARVRCSDSKNYDCSIKEAVEAGWVAPMSKVERMGRALKSRGIVLRNGQANTFDADRSARAMEQLAIRNSSRTSLEIQLHWSSLKI